MLPKINKMTVVNTYQVTEGIINDLQNFKFAQHDIQ